MKNNTSEFKSRTGMLKILLVTEDLPSKSPGGLAQHVLTLANALWREGHHADILGSVRRTDYGNAISAPSFPGKFFEEIPATRGWKELRIGAFVPMKRAFAARNLAKLIVSHANGYDVVHYHGHMPDVAKYLPSDLPFIQTRHDQGSECLVHTRFKQGAVCRDTDPSACPSCIKQHPNFFQRAISVFTVRLFRKNVARAFHQHQVIFVSNSLRSNYVRTAGGNAKSIGIVIHNHIDQVRILNSLKKSPQEDGDSIVPKNLGIRHVFIAGKISPEKGIIAFLKLMLPDIPSDMNFSIAGDGPDEEYLKNNFSHSQIDILGWRSYNEVIQKASTADIIVIPSVWEEPCATTVHEALFLGKPTLALRQGGTPELAQYERYPGQLMLFDDLQAMALFLRGFYSQGTPLLKIAQEDYGADISKIIPNIISQYRLQQSKINSR